MEEKTNVMRILEQKKIKYTAHSYINTDAVSGVDVAAALNENPDKVFKTLVTVAKSGKNYVFVIPVAKELDLKKAARAVGQKSLAMLHVKDINGVTGYIRGGCTAIGMKKQYRTVIEKKAEALPTVIVSGGRIGSQIELAPADLAKAAEARFEDVVTE